jgi:undecaprenyl-diphosphatase
MGVLEALGLGVLQGLTEFLPVSSSGHLSILEYFLGLAETPRFFDVMLHVGTLVAVLLFYRSAPGRIAASLRVEADRRSVFRIGALVVLGTLPTMAGALIFRPLRLQSGESLADADPSWTERIGNLREYSSQQPWVVLAFMTCTGAVLLAGARARGGNVDATTMGWRHAVVIGLAQMLSALCPGLSRSGMTVSAGMLAGLRGEWAVHYSLLLSVAAIAGATILKSRDVEPDWVSENIVPTALGTLAAAIVGWFCITLLVRVVRGGRWWWFAVYVWSFAVVAGLLLAFVESGPVPDGKTHPNAGAAGM